MEYLEDTLDTGETEEALYKLKSFQDHRGPYSPSDPEYLGSSYYLLIEWETGEITWVPLTNIMADDPYSCTHFGAKNSLQTPLLSNPHSGPGKPVRQLSFSLFGDTWNCECTSWSIFC